MTQIWQKGLWLMVDGWNCAMDNHGAACMRLLHVTMGHWSGSYVAVSLRRPAYGVYVVQRALTLVVTDGLPRRLSHMELRAPKTTCSPSPNPCRGRSFAFPTTPLVAVISIRWFDWQPCGSCPSESCPCTDAFCKFFAASDMITNRKPFMGLILYVSETTKFIQRSAEA